MTWSLTTPSDSISPGGCVWFYMVCILFGVVFCLVLGGGIESKPRNVIFVRLKLFYRD